MKNSRYISAPVIVLAALTLLAGCASTPGTDPGPDDQQDASAYPVTVDNCGEEVTIEAAPSAVFTVGTTALWNLQAAGAGDRVIARSGEFDAGLNNDDLTEFYADVPIIDPSDPTTEAIVSSGTDFVIGYGLFNANEDTLAEAGIGALINSDECAGGHVGGGSAGAVTVDQILADIERFGTVFDTQDQADATVADLQTQLDELAAQRPDEEATALIAYYFLGAFGSHGGTNVSNDILNRAGLTNVFADEPGLFIDPTLEAVIDTDPDYILINYGIEGETFEQARDAFLAEPGVSDLRAVQEGRIIGVPNQQLSFTAAAIDGIRTLIDGRQSGDSH